MKRFFKKMTAVITAAFMLSASVGFDVPGGITAFAVESGSVGTVNWSYDSGVLTISAVDGTAPAEVGQDVWSGQTWADYVKGIKIEEGVTSIASNAFTGLSSMQSISIPASMETIGKYAFKGSGLTSVTFQTTDTGTEKKGLKTIGDYAFDGATNLTTVTLPETLTSIGKYAFRNASLGSVIFPETLTNLGSCAFFGCTNLTTVEFKCTTMPTIGSTPFYQCKNNAKVPCSWGPWATPPMWTDPNKIIRTNHIVPPTYIEASNDTHHITCTNCCPDKVTEPHTFNVRIFDDNGVPKKEYTCICGYTKTVDIHAHKECVNATHTPCTHVDTTEWQAWDKIDSLPDKGNWYLTQPVTVDAATTITDTLSLCLNGKDISIISDDECVFNVEGTLNLNSCTGSGTINGRIDVSANAAFNMYGGAINTVETSIENLGTLYIGGQSKVTSTSRYYTTIISGDETAATNPGVSVTIEGGTIESAGPATFRNYSGATAAISGGTLENDAISGCIQNEGKISISDGVTIQAKAITITNGETNASAEVSITGGSFTSTSSTSTSKYIENYGTLNLSGNPTFTDTGIKLNDTSVINIAAALTYTDPCAIYVDDNPVTSAAPVTFTSGWADKMPDKEIADYFKSGSDYCVVVPDSTGEELALRPFIVTFDLNYTGCTAAETKDVGKDKTVSPFPNDPTRTDYTFKGWYTASEGGSRHYAYMAFSGDTTLYAHWECANNHSFGSYSEIDDEFHSRTCINCGFVEKSGHYFTNDWFSGGKGTEWDSDTDGHWQICLLCNATGAATGHTAVTDPAISPTCIRAGSTEGSHCDVCKYVITAQTEDPALGHSFTYSGEGNILTQSCGRNCGHNATATLDLDFDIDRTYSDQEIKPVKVVTGMGWSGETPEVRYEGDITNAGEHTAYIEVSGARANFEFTIDKAPSSIITPPTANTLTYNGSPQALVTAGEASGGTMQYSLKDGTGFSETIPTGTEAGYYLVYCKVVGDSNHNDYEDDSYTVLVNILKQTITPTVSITSWTYGEQASVPSVESGNPGDGKVKYEYKKSDEPDSPYTTDIPTEAGEYIVRATVAETPNYTDGSDEETFTIDRAELKVTADSFTIHVGDELPDTLTYTPVGLKYSDEIDEIGANITIGYEGGATPSGEGEGEYKIVVNGKTETTNYRISYFEGKLTISGKQTQTITADDVVLTYGDTDGKITATGNVGALSYTVKTGKDVISVDNDGNITIKNAGTATVEITAAETDDYAEATKPVNVTVNKKKVEVPEADNTTFTYNGNPQTYEIAESGLYTVSNNTQTTAGSYTVTVALNDSVNYEWSDALPTYTFVIDKAALKVTADSFTRLVGEELPALTYTSEGLKGTDKIDEIGANITIGYEGGVTPSGKGEYKIEVNGKTETTNYRISYFEGKLTISGKQTQTITADDVVLTYGDTDGKITASGNVGALSYTVKTGKDVISVDNDGKITIKKAGTATVEITAAETDDYASATATITVVIDKAAVTVTADSFTRLVGEELPALTYTSEGLKGTDKIDEIGANITIGYEGGVTPSHEGEYKIEVNGKTETANYRISYFEGKLTITEKPVVAAPVIDPNGGTFSSSQSVTITCDTEGAEIYYTTDGKDPTMASTKYEGAFVVTQTTTVKTIAVKDGISSDVASAKITIDREPTPPINPGRPRPNDPTGSTEPKYPKIDDKELSWVEVDARINKNSDGSKLTVDLNGNTVVPADVIADIANKKEVVTFELSKDISYVVDGTKISGKVSAADLSIGTSNTKLSTTNFSVIGGNSEKQFTLGNIEIPAKRSFALDKANVGKFASLMKLNSATGKYEFVSVAKIAADGKAFVDINGKGDYLLIIDSETKKPGDLNNDMIANALDAAELLKSIVNELSTNSFKSDYNGDGKVNALDASEILKVVVGLVPDRFDLFA